MMKQSKTEHLQMVINKDGQNKYYEAQSGESHGLGMHL